MNCRARLMEREDRGTEKDAEEEERQRETGEAGQDREIRN